MKKFLEDLKKELKKLNFNKQEIEEILSDHEEMIETAQNEGLTDEEIHLKFGDPEKLAQDLKENITPNVNQEGGENVEGYTLHETYQVVEKEFDVHISLISEDVRYEVHDSETIEVYYKKISDISKYDIGFDGKTLTVKREKSSNFLNFKKDEGKFIIRVPEGITSNTVQVRTVSGDGKYENLKTTLLEVKTTSGDVKVRNALTKTAKFSTVSGDLEFNTVTLESAALSMVSGDTKMENVQLSGDLDVNTVSGDVKIENGTANNFILKTVSGDLKGQEFYPKSVSLSSVSGDLKIENKEHSDIQVLRQKSVSGKVKING